MGSFKMGKMTLRSLFKEPETIQYPVVSKPIPAGLKGHIEVDMAVCILCGICDKTCPADAISVDKGQGSWSIDRFRCVQCGACTRACPKSCLTMAPEYQKPLTKMQIDIFTKPEESEEEKAAKEAAKQAKIEAAMKAKAEKENATS